MDERAFEIAASVTEALVTNGIDRVCSQVKKRDPHFSGPCEDCNEEVPELRQATGATTCIDCQRVRERTQALYAR